MRAVMMLMLVFWSASALGQSNDQPPTKTLSPYFFVDSGAAGVEAFPLKSTAVTATISGVVADVTVKQTYENQGAAPIHARYVFPGSTRAAVHGLRITVGTRSVVARIRERQQAAREFAEAKAAGKHAALLEQQRPNVFTMAVANIMPGDRVEVELVYSELLTPERGTYQFVYPTVVGPRYSGIAEHEAPPESQWVKTPYLHQGQQSPATFSLRVQLSTGVPLAELRSTSHAPRITWDGPAVAQVSLDDDAGTRDFVLDYRLAGRAIQSGLLVFEGPSENVFLLTVQPPARVTADEIPPREYIFVLDVSGSMHGFPLNTAKLVMQNLIGGLKPTDSFNVVLFAGGSRLLAPTSLPATAENVRLALNAIDGEQGGGGTELRAALARAVSLPRQPFVSRSVVVVTDGFIAQEVEAFTLIREHLDQTNFFAFGIGSSVNRYLIEGIAHAGQGEPVIVTDASQAAEAGDRFREYIQSPVLTNVRVDYDGVDAYDVEPQAHPDLFAERPIVHIGKWRGEKRGRITVTGQTPSGPFSQSFEMTESVSRPEHAALPQLWARTRIARLSDFPSTSGDAETSREVTTLGLTYSLLTKHTSFIAVIEAVRNPGGEGTDTNQPLPLPDGVENSAVGYGTGDEPSLWALVLGCAALVLLASRRQVWSW